VEPRKHKNRGRALAGSPGETPEDRPGTTEPEAAPADGSAASANSGEHDMREETKAMPTYGTTETQNVQRTLEGVSVIGEAVRAVAAESAEFVIEITANASSAAQALRENHMKSTQVAQAVAALGVQPTDLQTASLNVYNLYSQTMQALPPYGGQMGQAAYGLFPPGQAVQPEVQFGSYHARKALRIVVRDLARTGEIADAVVRAGATVATSSIAFRPSDESTARKAALEAAGKDARAKAEALAAAAGKQLGDPVAISEDLIVTNGTYTALRTALPFVFGAGAPQMVGDLEYYARVSARFRFA
jgi:uncharacterized protein YggE